MTGEFDMARNHDAGKAFTLPGENIAKALNYIIGQLRRGLHFTRRCERTISIIFEGAP
jgi:hypothetical protein